MLTLHVIATVSDFNGDVSHAMCYVQSTYETHPPENFLYKMGGLKALTSMSFCSERLFFCIFMYFKTD